MASPGEWETQGNMEENQKELSPRDSTRHRAIAARANYPAADRPDMMYAVKELCRGMEETNQVALAQAQTLGPVIGGERPDSHAVRMAMP
ncbi:hypothetical protein N9L68_04325 [bacterium]|nr:hypothetical protein [bacterium]